MSIVRLAKIVTVITVLTAAGTLPAFADRDEKKPVVRAAPMPGLGTGLPGLIVLAGGLIAFARRRR
jgi:hypothetical protein